MTTRQRAKHLPAAIAPARRSSLPSAATPTTIDAHFVRAELLADHAELELSIEDLGDAIAAGDASLLASFWPHFEAGLEAHMAAEEAELLPSFALDAPDDAAAIVRAHHGIRELAVELAVAIEVHAVRVDAVATFVASLRAHRIFEERSLYRWAEGRRREWVFVSPLASA